MLNADLAVTTTKLMDAPSSLAAREFESWRDEEDVRVVANEKTARPLRVDSAVTLDIEAFASAYVLALHRDLNRVPHVEIVRIERDAPTDARALVLARFFAPGDRADSTLQFWVASQAPGFALASSGPLPERLPNLERMSAVVAQRMRELAIRPPPLRFDTVLEKLGDGYRAHVIAVTLLGIKRVTVNLKTVAHDAFDLTVVETP